MARLKRTTPLKQILQQSKLKGLIRSVSDNQRYDYLIKLYLPLSLRGKCEVIKYQENTLHILVQSSVWATQLRYQIPHLKQQLLQHPELEQLEAIRYRVARAPRTEAPRKQPRPMKRLTPDNADLIRDTAESVEDPAIRESLLKLSRNRKL